MVNEQKRLDIISNNLANSATVGYKEENVTSRSFKDLMMTKIKDGSEAYLDREIGVSNPGVKIGRNIYELGSGFTSVKLTTHTIWLFREMDFLQ